MKKLEKMRHIIKYGKIFEQLDNMEDYKEINEKYISSWEYDNYGVWARKYRNTVKEVEYSCNKITRFLDPVKNYCGWDAYKINYYLRYGKWDEFTYNKDRLKNEIVLLNWNIYNSPTIPHDMIMYRFIPDEVVNQIIGNNKRGIPFQEKGFMSTTLSKHPGVDYDYRNVLKLYVSKNMFGLCADIISDGEEEFIFPPDCYIAMIKYPYEDKGRVVYPCQLKQFNCSYNASV